MYLPISLLSWELFLQAISLETFSVISLQAISLETSWGTS